MNSEPSNASADRFSTSVLLIDDNSFQRAHWADELRQCAAAYEVLEASDAQSGLELCRSRQIDCVVMELVLPDRSGFELLVHLLPTPSRPNVAVIILTTLANRGLWELATKNGAQACFVKRYTSGEYLDKAIQCSVALMALISKEDRHWAA